MPRWILNFSRLKSLLAMPLLFPASKPGTIIQDRNLPALGYNPFLLLLFNPLLQLR